MTRPELTRMHRQGMLGIVAGACLMVSACGAAAGSQPGQNQQSTIPAATQKFCNQVEAAMAGLSGKDPSNSMSLAKARQTLDSLLNNGITSFTKLQAEAPVSLKNSIGLIVADFKSYEELAAKAKTVKQLLNSSVRANPVQKNAYQELLSYASDSCS